MGRVFKIPRTEEQRLEEVRSEVTNAQMDQIRRSVAEEATTRSTEDNRIMVDVSALRSVMTQEITDRSAGQNLLNDQIISLINSNSELKDQVEELVNSPVNSETPTVETPKDESDKTQIVNIEYVENKITQAISEVKVEINEFEGATNDKAGTVGLVPAPPVGAQDKYLRGDGTWGDPFVYVWDIPSQTGTLTYNGGEQSPAWIDLDPLQLQIGGDFENKIDAGIYTAEFKPLGRCCWPDGTQTTKYVQWEIRRKVVPIVPTQIGSLTYNTQVQSPTLQNYDASQIDRTGDTAKVDAGNYTLILTPNKNHCWADGTFGGKELAWSIAVLKLTKPTATTTSYTYDRSSHSPVIVNYNSTHMTAGGDQIATDAGNYSVTYTLKSPDNARWADDSRGVVSIAWSIAVLKLTKPSASTTTLAYNGGTQTLNVSNYDSTYMNQTGTRSAKDVASYSVTYSLKDTVNTQWTTSTTADVVINWKIIPATVQIPAQSGSLTYNGYTQTVSLTQAATYFSITNDTAKDAGTYNATASLRDKVNYHWSDNTTTDKSIRFVIDKARVTVPSQSGTLSYDGNAKTPNWNNYNTSLMGIGGTFQNQTNAGTYSAIFTLKDSKNYIWSDGTTAANHTVSWTISSITLAKPYISGNTEFTYNKSEQGPNILNYNATHMNQTGTVRATNIGEYTATYALKNTTGTKWTDNTTGNVNLPWKILTDGSDEYVDFYILTHKDIDTIAPEDVTVNQSIGDISKRIYSVSLKVKNNTISTDCVWQGVLKPSDYNIAFNSNVATWAYTGNPYTTISTSAIKSNLGAICLMRGHRLNGPSGGLPDGGPQWPWVDQGYSSIAYAGATSSWQKGEGIIVAEAYSTKKRIDSKYDANQGVWIIKLVATSMTTSTLYRCTNIRTYIEIPAVGNYTKPWYVIRWDGTLY